MDLCPRITNEAFRHTAVYGCATVVAKGLVSQKPRTDESIAALNRRIMEPFYCSIDQDAVRVLIECVDMLEPNNRVNV